MPGVVIILLVLVVAFPVVFLVSMSVVAGLLGWAVKDEVDEAYAGTEDLAISQP
ncbi:MAG TPA: hypothetical protein VIY72_13450 [Acidimicrobiales bacterium]